MSKDVKYISKISVVIHKSTIMKSINILLDGLNIYLLVDWYQSFVNVRGERERERDYSLFRSGQA